MGRRIVVGAVWVIAGLAIAGGLITGAFALAGEDIADPATPDLPISTDDRTASPTPEPGRTQTPEADRGDGVADPREDSTEPGSNDDGATADDNSGSGSSGGDDNSGPGSGSDGGGDDNSGSGSGGDGDDNSGPGSGGDDSGSGSSDSGSGSDDDGDD